MELIAGCTRDLKNVRVSSFEGLTVDCLRRHGAKVVIRGLRAVSDFEYEFQMALMNKKLDAGCETVHLMPGTTMPYPDSSVIREIAALGGSVSRFVPLVVEKPGCAGNWERRMAHPGNRRCRNKPKVKAKAKSMANVKDDSQPRKTNPGRRSLSPVPNQRISIRKYSEIFGK